MGRVTCYWAKTAGVCPLNQPTNMWCIVLNHSPGKSLRHSNIPNYFIFFVKCSLYMLRKRKDDS